MNNLISKKNFFFFFFYFILIIYLLLAFTKNMCPLRTRMLQLFITIARSLKFLAKNPRKASEVERQRDRETMVRFKCNGTLKVKHDETSNRITLKLLHDFFHPRPEKFAVTEEIKEEIRQQIRLLPKDIYASLQASHPELTQKQVHYWWTQQMQEQYKKNNDQLLSAKILLEEAAFNVFMYNSDSGVRYIGFLTNFFENLKNNTEIFCDATCK